MASDGYTFSVEHFRIFLSASPEQRMQVLLSLSHEQRVQLGEALVAENDEAILHVRDDFFRRHAPPTPAVN